MRGFTKVTTARLERGDVVLATEVRGELVPAYILRDSREVRVTDKAGPVMRMYVVGTDAGNVKASGSQTWWRKDTTAGKLAAVDSSRPAASCEPSWHDGARVLAPFMVKVAGVELPPMHHGARATCEDHLTRSVLAQLDAYDARQVTVTRL